MYAIGNPGWNPATDSIPSEYDFSDQVEPEKNRENHLGFIKDFEAALDDSAPIRICTLNMRLYQFIMWIQCGQ